MGADCIQGFSLLSRLSLRDESSLYSDSLLKSRLIPHFIRNGIPNIMS
jgi:hypothetical protein